MTKVLSLNLSSAIKNYSGKFLNENVFDALSEKALLGVYCP